MMRSMDLRRHSFRGWFFALLLSLSLLSSLFSACRKSGADNGNDTLESVAEKTGAYLDSYDMAEKAAAGKEWVFLGLTLAGRTGDRERNAYLDSVARYVREKGGNRLHENKSTENSRVILGILSAGGDPEAIGGQDLLKGLSDLSYVRQQGNNGPMWALMAIDAIRE